MARKEYEPLLTPPSGIAIYPHLNRPDVYKVHSLANGKPQYKVNLSLSQEEATPLKKIEKAKKLPLL